MKILIVEDDSSIARILKDGLSANMHAVDIATNGADGTFMAKSFDYDAIILDYSLPKKNGLIVCKEIRAGGKTTPIIFLSVMDDPEIKVAAFESGADDYMVKPFSLQELYARLKVALRRPGKDKPDVLQIDDLLLDSAKHLVMRNGELIHLTRKEFGLLEYLMQNRGNVLSRALLMEHVWTADSDPFSNTVEAHIRNLRRKTGVGERPNLIVNIPGRGYMIDAAENLKRI